MSLLNDDEETVLAFLAEQPEDHGFWGFAGIHQHTSIEPERIRIACRGLRAKGFAIYESGLWTDDGEMAGSGYGATKAGVQFIAGEFDGRAK